MNSENADSVFEPDPSQGDSGILHRTLRSLWWITSDLRLEGASVYHPEIFCLTCGSADMIPVIYGLPCRSILSLAIEGLCEFGGLISGSKSSAWCCRACGYRGGRIRDLEGKPREDYLQMIAFVKMNCELLSDEAIEVSLMNESQHIENICRTLVESCQQRDELSTLVSGGVASSDWLTAILRKIRVRSF